MKKKVERLFGLYTNSLFFVLSIALLFLVFEAIGSKPVAQSAIGGAYTASSLPMAAVSITQVIVIGAIGLLVVGMLFMIQTKHKGRIVGH